MDPITEGITLDDIAIGDAYDIETSNRHYTLERKEDGDLYICGHPSYCGIETRCYVHGSMAGGWNPIRPSFIGVGMYMEFSTDAYDHILTSQIKSITKVIK